ncbi:X-ray radiation resistance-associated protein 1 isoform X2 [Betta splendens]|uniref:X-ray radiation resistance-associated protein 1 isoform X2 n=1 Tax=Betta splendens TaxID=158456 RepID=A0A6P7PCH4_BETSP|nr:X-ray radiation resistance-associated protein 1 isoform X2 [Betta splendens]
MTDRAALLNVSQHGRYSAETEKVGVGHWLVAFREAQEQEYKTSRIKAAYKNSRVTDAAGTTLDGALLLRLHCVDGPSELCSVDVSEQNLTSVKLEDLRTFDNVAYVDASINALSLGSFCCFMSLREINLSVNGIRNMAFDATSFPRLEVLNLSYNYLSVDDIVSVGRLTRLKVLHLSGNQLHQLPPDLGSSSRDNSPIPTQENKQFAALEVLILDDNKLTSGVFSSLANLKRLKYLNLQGNHISEVPYLQLTDRSAPSSVDEQTKETAHTEPRPITTESITRTPEEDNCEEHLVFGATLPLPELQFLNLAENKIAEEGALMAAALFPKLREIDIHSNPLTVNRSGDPPLLSHYLQKRLGISIQRKKPDAVKLPLKTPSHPQWKVEDNVAHASLKPRMEVQAAERKGSKEQTERFFVTQVADVAECDEERTAVNSERFSSCKMMSDVKLNPDAMEAVGIQTAVRMLEHTLKNLNVYRDSRPNLDSIQTPYREKERRIKDLPPLKPRKQPAERSHDAMREIRRSTAKREVALSSVIRCPRANEQEYNQAVALLRDMRAKYKALRRKTMEQAVGVEPGGAEARPGP